MGGCTPHHWFSWSILSVLQIYEQAWTTKQETIISSFLKCEISNAQNGVADDAVLEKCEHLDNNNSKNECCSTDEGLFYDQQKYHTTLPFCWVHSSASVLQVCTKYSPLNGSLKSQCILRSGKYNNYFIFCSTQNKVVDSLGKGGGIFHKRAHNPCRYLLLLFNHIIILTGVTCQACILSPTTCSILVRVYTWLSCAFH